MRKRFVFSALVAFIASICIFAGCSFGNNYLTAYANYLSPYLSAASDGEPVGLKFIDDKSAIVSVGEMAYPCFVQAKDADSFELTNSLADSENSRTEDQPSVFYVDFWENNATVSWSVLGVKVEKILSITQEKEIPAGVWRLFATKHGDEELVYKENGAGWTVILENGESYSGEGMDSAWVTKFISINDHIFQCLFDAKSGVIVDASLVVFDTTTFDYPVMIECYVSDGLERQHYFYSRLLQEDEKTDFSGGTFNAGAVIYESDIEKTPYVDMLVDSVAKWQLQQEKETEERALGIEVTLELREDQTVELEIKGDSKYRGRIEGSWYALQHSVLVVLDETSPLLGKTFTLFVKDSTLAPNEDDYLEKAITSLELYKCYKLGIGNFEYYVMKEDVDLYWGSQYENGNITPKLVYEKKYVLNAMWFEPYYMDEDFSWEKYEDNHELTPCPANGTTFLVFHEDGTFDITYSTGVTRRCEYTLKPYVEFDNITLYVGERENLGVPYLGIGYGVLTFQSSYIYDNGKGVAQSYIEFTLVEE